MRHPRQNSEQSPEVPDQWAMGYPCTQPPESAHRLQTQETLPARFSRTPHTNVVLLSGTVLGPVLHSQAFLHSRRGRAVPDGPFTVQTTDSSNLPPPEGVAALLPACQKSTTADQLLQYAGLDLGGHRQAVPARPLRRFVRRRAEEPLQRRAEAQLEGGSQGRRGRQGPVAKPFFARPSVRLRQYASRKNHDARAARHAAQEELVGRAADPGPDPPEERRRRRQGQGAPSLLPPGRMASIRTARGQAADLASSYCLPGVPARPGPAHAGAVPARQDSEGHGAVVGGRVEDRGTARRRRRGRARAARVEPHAGHAVALRGLGEGAQEAAPEAAGPAEPGEEGEEEGGRRDRPGREDREPVPRRGHAAVSPVEGGREGVGDEDGAEEGRPEEAGR
ncbi:hypothetical protein THAOC_14990, partial [Thalassiosira oceanica]